MSDWQGDELQMMDDDLAYINIEGDLIWVDQTQGKHYSPEEARRFAKMLLEAADKVEARIGSRQ
jgi:hypothetical protein